MKLERFEVFGHEVCMSKDVERLEIAYKKTRESEQDLLVNADASQHMFSRALMAEAQVEMLREILSKFADGKASPDSDEYVAYGALEKTAELAEKNNRRVFMAGARWAIEESIESLSKRVEEWKITPSAANQKE